MLTAIFSLFRCKTPGYFDMTAYASYHGGNMSDHIPTDEELKPSMEAIPKIPGVQE